jgi:hypothetical protein
MATNAICPKSPENDMALLLLLTSNLFAADPPKERIVDPKAIKGTWVLRGMRSTTDRRSYVGGRPFQVGDKEAEWPKGISGLFKDEGKGAIKVDTSKKPPTIELTVGKKVYKGIYLIRTFDGVKLEQLFVLINEPGGDFPTGFETKPFDLPKGFKGVLLYGDRKK